MISICLCIGYSLFGSSSLSTKGKRRFYICVSVQRKIAVWVAKKPDIFGLFARDIFFVSTLWSEWGDLNPRPLGPEGWSDIFSGHFEPFLHLSTRKISQRRPFRHGSFHLIFPRLGHGLGQDRKPAAQKLRRCKQRIGGDADRGWKGSFVIRLLCWSFAKAPDTAADTVVPPEYPAYCRAICRSCRVA